MERTGPMKTRSTRAERGPRTRNGCRQERDTDIVRGPWIRAMTAWLMVVGLSVLLSLGPLPTSLACSCMSEPNVTQIVHAADAVYIGFPQTTGDVSHERFQIVRVLKGPML